MLRLSSARRVLAQSSALAAFLAAIAIVIAFPAWAETAPTPAAQPAAPATASEAQEAQDLKVVEAALSDAGRGGFPALAPHLNALKQVMAHAPSSYPKIDRRSELIIIHSSDSTESLALMLMVANDTMHGRGAGSSVVRPNVYPTASLILGSYANEMQRYEEAVVWLDRGLAIQPYNPELSLEKATALLPLHRAAEGAKILQDALDHLQEWPMADRARLYRNLGVSYSDIDRFDEAEAALNESIRLQPDNPRARQELDYIAHRRAGAPAAPAGVILSNPPPVAHPEQGPDKGN